MFQDSLMWLKQQSKRSKLLKFELVFYVFYPIYTVLCVNLVLLSACTVFSLINAHPQFGSAVAQW